MSENNVDELLSIVEETKDAPEERKKERKSKYAKSVKNFVQELSIQPGTNRVPVHKLIYEYYSWKGMSTFSKASPREFGRIFSQFFTSHRSGTMRYYMLNEFCDISKPKLKESRLYYKKNFLRKKRTIEKKQTEEVENGQSLTTPES